MQYTIDVPINYISKYQRNKIRNIETWKMTVNLNANYKNSESFTSPPPPQKKKKKISVLKFKPNIQEKSNQMKMLPKPREGE